MDQFRSEVKITVYRGVSGGSIGFAWEEEGVSSGKNHERDEVKEEEILNVGECKSQRKWWFCVVFPVSGMG